MQDCLLEAGARSTRSALENTLRYSSNKRYWDGIRLMHELCDSLVEERINNPQPEIDDLLNVMLNEEDPETHTKLSRENIRFQMATFLVSFPLLVKNTLLICKAAGHETTAGTMAFLFYHLLANSEAYHRCQKAEDEVIGDDAIEHKHLSQLVYLDACIKEALRYEGPITVVTRRAKDSTKLDGKYEIDTETDLVCSIKKVHRDPAVWGDDADQFRPERMIPFEPVQNSWIPFGVGMRSCIGRVFATQEILINVALILQRFQVELADPSCRLVLKSTLSIKPGGFALKVRRRPGKSDLVGLQKQGAEQEKKHEKKGADISNREKKPLTVLYGSNAGTCKAFADELAAEAYGFDVKVQTPDSATEDVPTGHPVIVICPSYEGKPADNAKKFVSWLESNSSSANLLKGVQYTVFGVGNSEWKSSFHKAPKMIDEFFSKLGATRLLDAGCIDVKTDPIGPWEDYLEFLLPSLRGDEESKSEESGGISASVTASKSSADFGGPKLLIGIVRDTYAIADDSVGSPKMHTEIELPEDVTYQAGDYLSVLAHNSMDNIRRVCRRFGVSVDDSIEIQGTNKRHLRMGGPISLTELLGIRVELNNPVTQRQLSKLATFATDSKEKTSLEDLAKDETYKKGVLPQRFSALDILEDHQSCDVPFAVYLDMLKAMSMRQYSIASSPLSEKNVSKSNQTATLIYDVHKGPSMSRPTVPFEGVASGYLASLKPGAVVSCLVSTTNNGSFRLPSNPEAPIIMIAAGTGLAPMRGFIEERAALLAADKDRKLGPAFLYFGCRDFEKDYIHRAELEHWENMGAVQLRPVFSQRGPPDAGDRKDWKHVNDRIYAEADEVVELFNTPGAKMLLCGSMRLADGVAEVCKKIYKERKGVGEEGAEEWLAKVKEDRYVSDVFG